jgi:hypothetical protein
MPLCAPAEGSRRVGSPPQAGGDVGREAGRPLVRDLHQPALDLEVPGQGVLVAGDHGEVVQHLLVLEVGQGAGLLDGAAFQGEVGAA